MASKGAAAPSVGEDSRILTQDGFTDVEHSSLDENELPDHNIDNNNINVDNNVDNHEEFFEPEEQPIARSRVCTLLLGLLACVSTTALLAVVLRDQLEPTSTAVTFQGNVTALEVSFHDTVDDCWMILIDQVYDMSTYRHPGPQSHITSHCGREGTVAFQSFHPDVYLSTISRLRLGRVDRSVSATPAPAPGLVIPPSDDDQDLVIYQKEEIAIHNTAESCWTIFYGRVYDWTTYIDQHPGGRQLVLQTCGTDGTASFDPIPLHSEDMLLNDWQDIYFIGYFADALPQTPAPIVPGAPTRTPTTSPTATPTFPRTFPPTRDPDGLEFVTKADVSTHNTETDCWTIFYGRVYDWTTYIDEHPGGRTFVLQTCGGDGTEAFDPIPLHSEEMLLRDWGDFQIGILVEATNAPIVPDAPTRAPTFHPTASPTFPRTASPTRDPDGLLFVTDADVATHSTREDCWTIFYGRVYDWTDYVDIHQGGPSLVLQTCGIDGTSLFDPIPLHSEDMLLRDWGDFQVGILVEATNAPIVPDAPTRSPTRNPTATPTFPRTASPTRDPDGLLFVTEADVATHNIETDCWTIFYGRVYDWTSYIDDHPGGRTFVLQTCGGDGTQAFDPIPLHNEEMLLKDWGDFQVGILVEATNAPIVPDAPTRAPTFTPTATPTFPRTTSPTRDPDGLLFVTEADVATHSTRQDCWTIYYGRVYDWTDYIDIHQGGASLVLQTCGIDGTSLFDPIPLHNEDMLLRDWNDFQVGILVEATNAPIVPDAPTRAPTRSPTSSPTFPRTNPPTRDPDGLLFLSQADVATHSTRNDCWTIFYGRVYDWTNYIDVHQGGPALVLQTCGTDGTASFSPIPLHNEQMLLADFSEFQVGIIGVPPGEPTATPVIAPTATPVVQVPVALPPPTDEDVSQNILSVNEVSQHGTATDCWTILYDRVYDFTSYVNVHPGGAGLVISICGIDGTASYSPIPLHSEAILLSDFPSFQIGVVGDRTPAPVRAPVNAPVGRPAVGPREEPVFDDYDIAEHARASDCWIALFDKVYDMSSWVGDHPGGRSFITNNCGIDATQIYRTIRGHTESRLILGFQSYVIGDFESVFEEDPREEKYSNYCKINNGCENGFITEEELAKHTDFPDCWFALYGYVYDWTYYTIVHVGGPEVMLELCGTDGTQSFMAMPLHDRFMLMAYSNYRVGLLQGGGTGCGDNGCGEEFVRDPTTPYTLSEVEEHASRDDCWFVLYDDVYDWTNYIDNHPGGPDILIPQCGTDATTAFSGIPKHNLELLSSFPTFKIGILEGTGGSSGGGEDESGGIGETGRGNRPVTGIVWGQNR